MTGHPASFGSTTEPVFAFSRLEKTVIMGTSVVGPKENCNDSNGFRDFAPAALPIRYVTKSGSLRWAVNRQDGPYASSQMFASRDGLR